MNTQQQINSVISSLFNLLANLIACIVMASSISFPVIAIYVVLQVYYTVKYLRVYVELARLCIHQDYCRGSHKIANPEVLI